MANSRDNRRRFRLLRVFSLLAVGGLLLGYLSTMVSPATISWLYLFGISYPFWLVGTLISIVLFLLFRSKFAIIPLLALLFGWNIHGSYLQLLPKFQGDSNAESLKVMSYNVRLFDLYNWSENTKTRDRILALIAEEDPDIICFQEFYHTDREGVFETRDTLLKMLPFVDLHEKYTHKMRGKQYFGVATFSRFPIVARGEIPFETDYNNFCIYSDLKVGEDTIRMFNTHMASIRFQKEDYTFLESSESPENTFLGGQRIMKRLLAAAISRTEQSDRIHSAVKESPYEVVLCGDFNDTPVSYAYQSLRESLNDAFISKGSGIGNTYIGAFPSFRIDYILYSEGMETLSFEVLPDKHSDHHAIVAEFLK